MRRVILALMFLSTAAAPAPGERFAIQCKGTRIVGIQVPGKEPIGAPSSDRVIYVVDEDARTVELYDKKDKSLTEVCPKGLTCDRQFSADRIAIQGESSRGGRHMLMTFDWNRQANTLETLLGAAAENGTIVVMSTKMNCKPVAMPKLAPEGAAKP